jgi:hypothetical protein
MPGHPIRRAVGVAVVAAGLHGCAAIPLALIAAPLLNVSGEVLVKTGTEYSASGTVYRTFALPMEQVWGSPGFRTGHAANSSWYSFGVR